MYGVENAQAMRTSSGYLSAPMQTSSGYLSAQQGEDPIPSQSQTAGGGGTPVRAMGRVSVLVTARDYGRFLGGCLHSILAQTVVPHEIIYADDGSEDDSLQVAQQFEPHGVRILKLPHRGVVASRNLAAEQAVGDFLLHVDADNMLAPDFLDQQLRAMTDDAAFAYCAKRFFGDVEKHWQPPEWNRDKLWIDNYVDTSCLMRREVFEAAGRWQDTSADTMWDWDMALRMSRHGRGVPADATLHYRYHQESWTSRRDARQLHRFGFLKGTLRRAAARMTICTMFSGRLPELFPQWLEGVAAALDPPQREQPELFIIDDSPHGFWSVAQPHMQQLLKMFRSLRVDRVYNGDDWSHRRPDRARTARHLATAYNRLLTESASEVVWFVEDDIVLPAGAGRRMLQLLLDGDAPKAAVSGLYKSRHEDCYVVGSVDGGHVTHADDLPGEPEPWDLAGTGCLMVFRPMTNATFRPFWHIPGNGRAIPAHDWAFSWQLRQNQQPVWLHPEIRCRHYKTETQWV